MKTILLIHGWNYDNYHNRTQNKNAWENRKEFIEELKKYYNVIYPNLPGFGIAEEPKEKEWTLNNYANYINEYIKNNNLNIDYILGYSFGGAVAIRYKTLYNKNSKLILISPAIIRNQSKTKKFIKTPKSLENIRKIIRNLYTIYIVKTPEMKYGTSFLRNTYQIIVRDELIGELEEFNSNDYLIIYGEKDNMVDPNRMINESNQKIKKKIKVIQNGGHDIANTHTKELINIISNNCK